MSSCFCLFFYPVPLVTPGIRVCLIAVFISKPYGDSLLRSKSNFSNLFSRKLWTLTKYKKKKESTFLRSHICVLHLVQSSMASLPRYIPYSNTCGLIHNTSFLCVWIMCISESKAKAGKTDCSNRNTRVWKNWTEQNSMEKSIVSLVFCFLMTPATVQGQGRARWEGKCADGSIWGGMSLPSVNKDPPLAALQLLPFMLLFFRSYSLWENVFKALE